MFQTLFLATIIANFGAVPSKGCFIKCDPDSGYKYLVRKTSQNTTITLRGVCKG